MLKVYLMKIASKRVLLFFIFIIIIRFSLIGKGMIAIPDEVRYFYSPFAVESLEQGNWRNFWINIHTIQGRPGDALVKLIPAYIQMQLNYRLGVYQENQKSLIIPTVFNVIISIFLLLVFYKLSKYFLKEDTASFISLLIYALLTSSNIYIRHVLPYEYALVVDLYLLYLILTKKSSIVLYSIVGFFAGFGFTIYPGYYYFAGIILVFILKRLEIFKFTARKFIMFLSFIFLFFTPLLFMEYTAKLVSRTYIQELLGVSTLIIQGSYQESFTFLMSYLVEVERYIGVFLLFVSIIYLINTIYKIIADKSFLILKNDLNLLGMILIAGYLIQAANNFRSHSVFYGRLIHMYIPFLVWMSISIVYQIRKKKIRNNVLTIVLLTSFISFANFYLNYLNMDYPRDIIYNMGINTNLLSDKDIVFESNVLRKTGSPAPWDVKTNYPYNNDPNYVLVNFGYLFNFKDSYGKFIPDAKMKLIYDKPHFLLLPAYQYEGFSPLERKFINERKYEMKIYKRE
jgi:hypothetical protein